MVLFVLAVNKGLCTTFRTAFEKVSVDIGCKRKLTQNSFMQTGLTMGKGADIFALVSRGHRSDRIPPRESPRRAHGTLQPVWMKVS